ncbi:MAG: CehA/McbA family metallohydrolase [Eubacteriales bacterium]|jgi:hypothetical protein
MTLYHTKPEFVLRERDFVVNVITDDILAGEIELSWSAGTLGDCIRMGKSDTFVSGGAKYALLSAVIPASALSDAETVKYSFSCKGEMLGEYEVQVSCAGKLPPLMVTELFLRPKGLGVTSFIEVANPTEGPVDLYDYKLLVFNGEDITAPARTEVHLADGPGREIVNPGELAVLWLQYPNNHNLEEGKYTTAEGFCEACMNNQPGPEYELSPDELHLVKLEFCRFDEEKAKYVLREGFSELPSKNELVTLLFVPRDGGPNDAVYSLVYNKQGDSPLRDTPVRHSSVWGIDVRNPGVGVVYSCRELMTPGRLAYGQSLPHLAAEYPVIFPTCAGGSIRASVGELAVEFEVLSGRVSGAWVGLRCEDGTCYTARADKTERGFMAKFPEEITDRLGRLEYFITVYDGVRYSTLGSSASPIVTRIIDDKGPTIISLMPTEKYAYDTERRTEILVEFFDISGVDLRRSILCVDRKNVSSDACWEPGRVSYIPSRPLKYGTHEFDILLKDKLGNKTYRRVEFTVCRPDKLSFYRGEVHSHTADSDGTGVPAEAMAYAREVGKVDFFSLTEHSHYMLPEGYARQIKNAEKFNEPGKFAALYGWEMTWNNKSGYWGHMNILNTKWIEYDIHSCGLPEMYERLKRDRHAVAMFNHPGLPWGNFVNFSYWSPEVDRRVCLAEIKSAGYDREYMNLLSLGWHASPAFNEDNHKDNWTTGTGSTTYVLAPALTRENIIDAFRRRRTYSTSDPTMKVLFKINGEVMGARLRDPDRLDVDVKIETEAEAGIGKIELVAEDNIIVASVNAGALRKYHWKLTLDPLFDYYYVRITGKGRYTVTAPVWIEGGQPLSVKKLTWSRGENDYKPNEVSAKIKNSGTKKIKELVVDFYLVPGSGFDINTTAPYATVKLSGLTAGRVVNVLCRFPDLEGMRRVSVVVRGMYGGRQVCDTAMLLFSPIKITELCAKTSPVTDSNGNVIDNPFPYLQLYNASNRDIVLGGYYTRLWHTTGRAPSEERMLKLDGAVIKAGGTLTLWRKPQDSSLTVEDFNRRYGVMLKENEDILVSEQRFISSSNDGRRLEVMLGTETLARVEYNFGKGVGRNIVQDRAIVFDLQPNMTGTARILTTTAKPSPGGLRKSFE